MASGLNLWKKKIAQSVITQIDAKTKLQELTLKNFKKSSHWDQSADQNGNYDSDSREEA